MTGIDGQPCGPPYRESVVGHGTNGLDEANFGGDGGGTLTDPANECNIAQDYVYLSIQVTQNCAVNDGSWIDDASKVTSYDVAPADNATGETRFIAPLAADAESPSTWIAGGRHVGADSRVRHPQRRRVGQRDDLGADHTATAVAASGGKVYAAWCGPCNNQGSARGISVGNAGGTSRTESGGGTGWHDITLPVDGTVPNRYLCGFAVDPKNAATWSSRSTASPGSGPRARARVRVSAMSSSPRTAAPPGRTSPGTSLTCRPTPPSSHRRAASPSAPTSVSSTAPGPKHLAARRRPPGRRRAPTEAGP